MMACDVLFPYRLSEWERKRLYLSAHPKVSNISWLYMLHSIFSNGPNSARNYAYK